MQVNGEGIAVVAVQAVIGAEPDKAFPVLKNTKNSILRKALFTGQAFEDKIFFTAPQGQNEKQQKGKKLINR